MLTWLAELSPYFTPLNVFRYITFRTGGATATALLFVFWFVYPPGMGYGDVKLALLLGWYVDWMLLDNASGATVYSTSACGSKLVSNVPAGQYRLKVQPR